TGVDHNEVGDDATRDLGRCGRTGTAAADDGDGGRNVVPFAAVDDVETDDEAVDDLGGGDRRGGNWRSGQFQGHGKTVASRCGDDSSKTWRNIGLTVRIVAPSHSRSVP